MVELTRHHSQVHSVFDLLGRDENDLTAALGFTLANSPALLAAIAKRLRPHLQPVDVDQAHVALEVRDPKGRTDLEITLPGALIICEAKRGWLLPGKDQLRRYVGRIRRHGAGVLVTLSQASKDLADYSIPAELQGVPIVHLPWSEVMTDITAVASKCRGRERLWIGELQTYLKGVVRVRDVADSRTYCVSLSTARTGGQRDLTFIEWVTDEHTYYHPYGMNRWPAEPPNFIAFRWDGAVQRIHRIIKSDVVPTLLDRFPDLPANEKTLRPHAIYTLSKTRLPPVEPIPNGAPYRANRFWVLLDQLQTAPTLAAAYKRSRTLLDEQK